jgi:hypothetical protein
MLTPSRLHVQRPRKSRRPDLLWRPENTGTKWYGRSRSRRRQLSISSRIVCVHSVTAPDCLPRTVGGKSMDGDDVMSNAQPMDALTDFISQMHLAALEESPLWAIPLGSIDHARDGLVTHGPWPAATCAAVLRIWHAAGWIELYHPILPSQEAPTPADRAGRLADDGVLSAKDAETLLDHPERWMPARADGHTCLYTSDTGDATPWPQWHQVARATAQHLPLTEGKPEP